MKNNIVTKIVNDVAIGDYTVVINYNNNTITTIIDLNVFMYQFDKDELITDILIIAPDKCLNDFIVDIIGDQDLTEDYLTELKSM